MDEWERGDLTDTTAVGRYTTVTYVSVFMAELSFLASSAIAFDCAAMSLDSRDICFMAALSSSVLSAISLVRCARMSLER